MLGCFNEFTLPRFESAAEGNFEHAENAGHGGAQLVAHVGEELALGPVGRLGRLFCLMERFLRLDMLQRH